MKGYKEFQELLNTDYWEAAEMIIPGSDLVRKEKVGKVNRIAARLKFVNAFEEIKAKDYTAETLKGYNGLFKVFITFSAFEGFIQLFPEVNQHKVELGFTGYKYSDISDEIRSLDKQNKLLDFLTNKSNSHLSDRIVAFKDGENRPLAIARAIRHIFAHGKLTPNVDDANPEDIVEICDRLCRLMIDIMDTEFEKKVNKIAEDIQSNSQTRQAT